MCLKKDEIHILLTLPPFFPLLFLFSNKAGGVIQTANQKQTASRASNWMLSLTNGFKTLLSQEVQFYQAPCKSKEYGPFSTEVVDLSER